MTFEDYFAKHGTEFQAALLRETQKKGRSNPDVIAYGMLQFTTESAPCLAGSYPGDMGVFVLRDYRFAMVPSVEKRGGFVPALAQGDRNLKEHPEDRVDYPTSKKPFQMRIAGTDDSSWSKFYGTEEDARGDLKRLEDGQPLDLEKDVLQQGFEA
jgi:hypothetical protein